MALIPLSYCNVAMGTSVSFNYDDVAHSVSAPTLGAGCSSGPPTGHSLYTQISGGTQYDVRVQNGYPYAYVSAVPVPACSVAINSVTIGNASTNESNDGSLIVNAESGVNTKVFILEGYSTEYQASNHFFNLPAGTYTVKARSTPGDGTFCYDTEVVVIPFNALASCDLELGNILAEGESTLGANDGAITVNTIIDPVGLLVEYRIDSGAWQDSPNFTGLAAGTYDVQVRYKNFTGCSDSREVEILEGVTCDVFIQNVAIVHEQAKFADDGSLTIHAVTSNGSLIYSIDDGDNYQASNIFLNLAPGVYIVRVQDAEGCEDSTTVEVLKWKAAQLLFPMVNSNRVVLLEGPSALIKPRQNFENRLIADMHFPGFDPCEYRRPVQTDDIDIQQFRSNYTSNTVKLYNAADTLVATIVPTKKSSNLNKTDSRAAMFANAGAGETQIFFENGLPVIFEVGMDVTIDGQPTLDGTYEITDIRQGVGVAEGYEVLIVVKDYTSLSPVLNGTLDTVYDLELYEVWEFAILWQSYPVGKYYFTVEGSDVQLVPYFAQSEPIHSAELWEDHTLLLVRNYENDYQIDYTTGIVHTQRVRGYLEFPITKSKRTVHEDSKDRMLKLQERLSLRPKLLVFDLPYYVLVKLAAYFAHDYYEVDGVEHQSDEDFDMVYFPNDPTGNGSLILRQVDFIAENTHDDGSGDVDISILGSPDATLLGVP